MLDAALIQQITEAAAKGKQTLAPVKVSNSIPLELREDAERAIHAIENLLVPKGTLRSEREQRILTGRALMLSRTVLINFLEATKND